MQRWGLNLLCGVSLLVCVGSVVAWAWSVNHERLLTFIKHSGNSFGTNTEPGGVNFSYLSNSQFAAPFYPPFKPLGDGWHFQSSAYDTAYSAPPSSAPQVVTSQPAGNGDFTITIVRHTTTIFQAPKGRWGHFGYRDERLNFSSWVANSVQCRSISVSVPLWFIMIFSVVPLVVRLMLMRRHSRRAMRSLCRTCGYNLRGNTSGVCPECGSAIVAPAH